MSSNTRRRLRPSLPAPSASTPPRASARRLHASHCSASAAPSPAPTPTPAPTPHPATWHQNWWPVLPLSYLDPSRPTAVKLLGSSLVVWRDGSGTWRCFQDMCPHRLAPLSEGRVEGGQLMCSYHGWRFTGEGSCTAIPQAADPRAVSTAASSLRCAARSFPTQAACGLLFVWPDSSPGASSAAAAAPLPLTAAQLEPDTAAWLEGGPNWFCRELPYDYDVLVENLLDPAHVPFSHHLLTPGLNRYSTPPMPFTPAPEPLYPTDPDSTPLPPAAGFEFPSSIGEGRLRFYPPALLTHHYLHPDGSSNINTHYNIPTTPGSCRIITVLIRKPPRGGQKAAAPLAGPLALLQSFVTSLLPPWLATVHRHLIWQKLFDGDGVFLHHQAASIRALEAAPPSAAPHSASAAASAPAFQPHAPPRAPPLHPSSPSNGATLAPAGDASRAEAPGGKAAAWQRNTFTPVTCDLAVVAVRRWWDRELGGPLPYAEGQGGGLQAGKQVTRQQLLDRYSQHTRQCPACGAALSAATFFAAASQLLALVSLSFVGGLAGQAVAVGALPVGAAAAWGLVVAAVGAGAAWGAWVLRGVVQRFHFVDFVHADNH